MKNLANEYPDVVEELPSRDKLRPAEDGRDHYRGRNYPWKKVYNFLTHRVGKNWDDVFSEFVHLTWVHDEYKTREQIANTVLVNTFMKDGEVYGFERYGYMNPITHSNEVQITNSTREQFYIHPETKILCFFKPKKVDWKRRQREEEAKTMRILGDYHQLLKLDGIWFEVKGKKKDPDVIEIDGLHWKKMGHFVPPETRTMKFGGRKYTAVKVERGETPYKVINGEYYVPSHGDWRYGGKPLGPKDRLIELGEGEKYYWNRSDYDSVRIIVRRQLNSKELKKYGLRNDVKVKHRCITCGSTRCIQRHDRRCDICGARWCSNHEHHKRIE